MTSQTVSQQPTSLRFGSRTGGAGHDVVVRTDSHDRQYVTCTCPGGRFAWAGDRQGKGCWAMKAARQMLSIELISQ